MNERELLESVEKVRSMSWTDLNRYADDVIKKLREDMKGKREEEIRDLLRRIDLEYGMRKHEHERYISYITFLERLKEDPCALVKLAFKENLQWEDVSKGIEILFLIIDYIDARIQEYRERRERVMKALRFLEKVRAVVVAKLEDLEYGRRG